MKIASWNVNSVRARIENILNYISDFKPDILFLQETHCDYKNELNYITEFKRNGF